MSVLLSDFKSICGERQKIIVCEEKRNKYTATNKDESKVRQYLVDGDIFEKGKPPEKCDYLVLNDDKKHAYFIELKGSDLSKAMSQIENAVTEIFNKNLSGYKLKRRIVYSGSATHDLHSRDYLKWKEKYRDVICREKEYSENI